MNSPQDPPLVLSAQALVLKRDDMQRHANEIAHLPSVIVVSLLKWIWLQERDREGIGFGAPTCR